MSHHPSTFKDDTAPFEAEILEIVKKTLRTVRPILKIVQKIVGIVRKLLAWRSTRLFAFLLLLIATVIGAHLRFHRLAHIDMSGDEGATWAAASAPSVEQVAAIERRLDPGKFALYDVMLHEWIGVFGDSLFAMRAMSATLGTIAIILVFVAVREVWRSLVNESTAAVGELAGAFAALLYATNLEMVLSDRTARMYPLMMCAELLQITFFVRAQRRRGWLHYVALALFTALMIAANFASIFLMATEGLWLGCLLTATLWNAQTRRRAVFRTGYALAAGMALLLLWQPGVLASSRGAMNGGTYDWIKLQPISWPYTVLRDSSGDNTLFWIFVALAAFGVWRKWRSELVVAEFFAVWTAGPLLAVLAVSYLIHPLEFPRYVLISFVGMFALAGLGAASVRSAMLRIVLAILLINLSVTPVHDRVRHSDEAAWRDATMLATQRTTEADKVAVSPPYCINVVRFYMPPARRDAAISMGNECGQAPVLILSGRDITAEKQIAAAETCYPRVIAKLKLIEVRAR
jgi:mannosyltransferase